LPKGEIGRESVRPNTRASVFSRAVVVIVIDERRRFDLGRRNADRGEDNVAGVTLERDTIREDVSNPVLSRRPNFLRCRLKA